MEYDLVALGSPSQMFLGRLLPHVVFVSHSSLLVAPSTLLATYYAPPIASYILPISYFSPPVDYFVPLVISLFLLVGGLLVSWVF